MTDAPPVPSRRTLLTATAVALAVAAIILIVAVLPAEYGIDLTGLGRVLGLTAMSQVETSPPAGGAPPAPLEAVRAGVNTLQRPPMKGDRFDVELKPFEGVEYKYRMEKGASLVYSWTSSAAVAFEFHGEPEGAPAKYFESYQKAEGTSAAGSFLAPAKGIHGWYWKNPGATRVTITLTTTGFYAEAIEFRDGDRIVHAVSDK